MKMANLYGRNICDKLDTNKTEKTENTSLIWRYLEIDGRRRRPFSSIALLSPPHISHIICVIVDGH